MLLFLLPTGDSGTSLLVWGIVTLVASNTVTALLTNRFLRREQPSKIDLSEAQAALARAQTGQSVAETLQTVSAQLQETTKALREATELYESRTPYIELLETQVARARAAGFIERTEHGGAGPNPAA